MKVQERCFLELLVDLIMCTGRNDMLNSSSGSRSNSITREYLCDNNNISYKWSSSTNSNRDSSNSNGSDLTRYSRMWGVGGKGEREVDDTWL